MSFEKRSFQCGTKTLSESFYSLGSFSFSTKNFELKLTWFELKKKTRGVNQYESSLEALELSSKNQKKYQLQIRTVQNDLDRVLAEYKSIKDRFWTFDKYLCFTKYTGLDSREINTNQSTLIAHSHLYIYLKSISDKSEVWDSHQKSWTQHVADKG